MKKLIVVIIVLFMLVPYTYAEVYDIDFFEFEYNLNTVITGAKKLPENGYTFDGHYYQWITDDGEITGFIVGKSGKINQGFCVCSGEDKIGDFLSRCATIAFTLDTIDDLTPIYTCLMYQYFKAKTGEENSTDIIRTGVVMHITLMENGKYLFLIVNNNL